LNQNARSRYDAVWHAFAAAQPAIDAAVVQSGVIEVIDFLPREQIQIALRHSNVGAQ